MSNSNNTVPSNGTSDQRGRNITTGLFGLSNEIIRIIFYTKVCNIISDADLQVSPQFISEEDYEMEGENEILCTPKPKQLRKSNKGKSYEYY